MARPSPIIWRRTGCCLRDRRVEGCTVRDAMTDSVFDIRARTTLVAAGPWADLFLEHATDGRRSTNCCGPRAFICCCREISLSALTVEAGSGHFFVLPWRGHTLLGTTDTQFRGDPASVAVSENDIGDFLGLVNRYLPAAGLDARAGAVFLCRPAAAGG